MNSSINPSSDSSNSDPFNQVQTEVQITNDHTTSASEGTFSHRQQPIPPPSEPMQYRAIGLVRGSYKASAEQLTQGTLVATDGTEVNAVLLGRIISLLKNYLDLEQEHLWVVYPRIGQKDESLHLQIVGVWEPDRLSKPLATERPIPEEIVETSTSTNLNSEETQETTTHPERASEVEDGYFSIRGEVVYQSAPDDHFIVKIKQAPRKEFDKPKYFKLKIQGNLGTKAIGQFWDLEARRQADSLVLQKGEAIAALPSKPKIRKNKPHQAPNPTPRRNWDIPSPVRKAGDSKPVTKPIPKTPAPKPVKRQKPPQ